MSLNQCCVPLRKHSATDSPQTVLALHCTAFYLDCVIQQCRHKKSGSSGAGDWRSHVPPLLCLLASPLLTFLFCFAYWLLFTQCRGWATQPAGIITFSQPTTQLHYYQSSLVFAQHSGRLDIIFVKMLCLTIIAGYWQHLLPSLDQDTFQLFSPKWLLQNFLNADNDLSKNVKKKKGGNWPLAKRSCSLYLIPLFVSCPWSSWEFCWSYFHHPRHPYWSSLLWLLLFDKEGEGICQSWKRSLLLMLLLSESVLTWQHSSLWIGSMGSLPTSWQSWEWYFQSASSLNQKAESRRKHNNNLSDKNTQNVIMIIRVSPHARRRTRERRCVLFQPADEKLIIPISRKTNTVMILTRKNLSRETIWKSFIMMMRLTCWPVRS